VDQDLASRLQRWREKPGLRRYYREEIFDRIIAHMVPGPGLEIGAGPSFFHRRYDGDLVALDIDPGTAVDVRGDVHALPFADDAFANVVGTDVLHHLSRPALALREIARVLQPGGHMVLVEPWTGALGWLFYRFVHHEDCAAPKDVFSLAPPMAKDAMEGNAAIPRAVLAKGRATLAEVVPELEIAPPACFTLSSYLATGGFQGMGAPAPVIDALRRADALLPAFARPALCLRAVFVAEKRVR
jgi:SAM-dependent methyltransferase